MSQRSEIRLKYIVSVHFLMNFLGFNTIFLRMIQIFPRKKTAVWAKSDPLTPSVCSGNFVYDPPLVVHSYFIKTRYNQNGGGHDVLFHFIGSKRLYCGDRINIKFIHCKETFAFISCTALANPFIPLPRVILYTEFRSLAKFHSECCYFVIPNPATTLMIR